MKSFVSTLFLLVLANIAIAAPNVPEYNVENYASLELPGHLAFDSAGNIYVTHYDLDETHYIRRVGVGGSPITNYGNSAFTDGDAVAVDINGNFSGKPGTVLVGSGSPGRVWGFEPNESVAFNFNVGVDPEQMIFDNDGKLLILDPMMHSVFISDGGSPSILFITIFEGYGIAVDSQNRVFVGDSSGHIYVYENGSLCLFATLPNKNCSPLGIAYTSGTSCWPEGLYVINNCNGVLSHFDSSGNKTDIGSGFVNYSDLAFGPDGAMYISSEDENTIWRICRIQTGTIIVEKQTSIDGDSTLFNFTGDISGQISDNKQIIVSNLLPGTYNITEQLCENWVLSSITVDDDDSSVNVNTQTASINLEAGEIVKVVFYNTSTKGGTIIVEKKIAGCSAGCCTSCDLPQVSPEFEFTGDVSGTIQEGEQIILSDLSPGVYTTQEIVPEGWRILSIKFNDQDSYWNPDTGVAYFNLQAGETIKAEITNIQQFTLDISSTIGGRVICLDNGEIYSGQYVYDCGTSVTLLADADESFYEFAEWEGLACNRENPQTLVITCDRQIRAKFESILCTLHVDAKGSNDPGPNDATISDPMENGTELNPFDSIQETIEVARTGATILVEPGTYWENIDFMGKNIKITGNINDTDEFPVIDGNREGIVVTISRTCSSCLETDPELSNFVITGGRGLYAGGIKCFELDPVISNCLIVGNQSTLDIFGGGALYCENSTPLLVNCTIANNYSGNNFGAGIFGLNSLLGMHNSIVWDNLPSNIYLDSTSDYVVNYSDVNDGWPGEGNLDIDPEFVQPGYWADQLSPEVPCETVTLESIWIMGDYHLQSSSPVIDAGNPDFPVKDEPYPNGNIVNMGVYGGTTQAAKSE